MIAARALVLAALGAGAALAAGCRPRAAAPAAPVKPPPSVRDPGSAGARAFARIRELAGNWIATGPSGEVPISFEVVERGHAVVQRGGFFVVWHADGNALAAAVFAAAGHHARMRSTQLTDGPRGELTIELATIDSGNVFEDEPVAQTLTMTIAPQNDAVLQRWRYERETEAPIELQLQRTDTGALPPSTKEPPPPTAPAAPPPAPSP